MERSDQFAGALSCQLSMACIFCTAAYWFAGADWTGAVFPLALIPFAVALCVVNRLFLRRERSAGGVVRLNLIAGLAMFAVLAAAIGWGHWKALAFAAVACLWLTIQGGWMVLDPPALPSVILCLDGSLLVLILFVAYGAASQVPGYQLIPACVGCAGALLGLILRRMGGRLGARGWAFLGAAFLVILALVFLLVGVAAAPAGQGVVALWGGVTAAARAAAAVLSRLWAWIFSLFPAQRGKQEINIDPMQVEVPEEVEEMQANPLFLLVLIILLAAAVIGVVVWGLRRLDRIPAGGRRTAGRVGLHRRRISLRRGLRRLLERWAAWLRLRIWLVRSRNTPEGVYYLLVRRFRMGPLHKRPGETPREFLRRLGGSVQGDGALDAALAELIEAVDAAFYAPPAGRPGIAVQSRLIRRRLGAAARRSAVQDARRRLAQRREAAKREAAHSRAACSRCGCGRGKGFP